MELLKALSSVAEEETNKLLKDSPYVTVLAQMSQLMLLKLSFIIYSLLKLNIQNKINDQLLIGSIRPLPSEPHQMLNFNRYL